MRFEELVLLALNLKLRGLKLLAFFVFLSAEVLHDGFEHSFEVGTERRVQTDPLVDALDTLFDFGDLDGTEVAVGSFGVASGAGEVVVEFAGTPGTHFLHQKSGCAVAAEER
ncbi:MULTISPECIES: hypothetical protein [unclassified Leucobacter]|uniref:hypothetical protein n=1 Tax=unclassified Leucobacter TaxID=2621730 RepID=UPI003018C85F